MRQRVRSRLAVALGALFLALALPVGASGIHDSCASAASGPSAAVVVDFGDVSDQGAPPGGVVAACVPLTGRVTGAQALVAAGFPLSLGPGGYVCAIDGYPADGCGEQTGTRKYLYWSYWKSDGQGAWGYAGTGASTPLKDGATEGWRFVEGSGSPNDPQPRSSPDHDSICGPPTAGPVAPSAPAASGEAAAAPGGATPSSTTPTAPVATPDDAAVDDSTTSSAVPQTATDTTTAPTDDLALAAATPARSRTKATSAVGVMIVLAVIAALAAAAFFRSRRSGTE